MTRVLLLISTRSYRSKAFMQAARRLGVEVVVGSERRQALASRVRNTTLALDFRRPDRAARIVAEFARAHPLDAVVGVDDDSTLVAAAVAARVGLPHNSVDAVRTARDKYRARRALSAAGLPSPTFQRLSIDDDPDAAALRARYPCVLKPVALSASRGVIRADRPEQFVDAFKRIASMLRADRAGQHHLLVETFLPGPEVALEGLLTDGRLRVLALFDKPDPLDGPFFEETIYVTPSRLPATMQDAVTTATARAAEALGLRSGPLHAELRLGEGRGGPYVLEVAPRSIGGLCSNALRFGAGLSLEELILRHAVEARHGAAGPDPPPERERLAAGAMMLPIPRAGTLHAVLGRADAEGVAGVEEVTITIPLGASVVPLPEGDRYLGFVFARGSTPEDVVAALRAAHERLRFVIAPPGEAPPDDPGLPAAPARTYLPVLAGDTGGG